MTKTKEKNTPSVLSRKQQQLVINSCELLDNKAQLTSDWNRIIKPELILLFDTFSNKGVSSLTGLSIVKKATHYQINKNTKEYNMFDSENFKKEYPELFRKFSKKNVRTNWTYSIKEV
jgi:hypothetical protein